MPGTLPGGGAHAVMGLAEEAMDQEGKQPEGLRLPESLAESGDPVEGNPYPPEHPAHQVWNDSTRLAEMEVSRINATAPELLTPATSAEWMPTLVVSKFDVWARRGVQVVWTDDAVRQYDHWLVNYANDWIDAVSRFLTSHPPPFASETVLDDLRRRLAGRVHHWKAEARHYRVQQEARAAAATAEVQRPPSDQLLERRRRAVRKYRDDHDLDAVGFARTIGISDTVVRAIVRDDWTRFNRGTQQKLLAVLGMTREDWYGE
jgi:hypothetical protein